VTLDSAHRALRAAGRRAATDQIARLPAKAPQPRTTINDGLVRRHLAWSGLRAGESFLDVGCVTGRVVAEAARITSRRVVGLDASPERLMVAREACRRARLFNVEFRVAEIRGLGSSGLPAESFDHVWARFCLQYQPDPRATMREFVRLLKPGGKLTLIDLDGNGVRHFGMDPALQHELDELLADLDFDPEMGNKLPGFAIAAGLVDVRHEIEPYHRVVGVPDPSTAAAWQLRLAVLRDADLTRLFPDQADRAWVFDAFLAFLQRRDTVSWSLLHLVQATKPCSMPS
jgi:SAM-dependent methyltransferase